MLTRHIYLIGMPGSGKTSLGRKVASLLHLPFIDMDKRIEEISGGAVTDFFANYGEQAFRNVETNLLIQITRERPAIVSTGGGTVMREENLQIMKNSGVILLNDRPLENILSDIKLDRRPMLAAKGLDGVNELYHQRIEIYRAAADIIFHNDGEYFDGVNGLKSLLLQKFNL